MSELKKITRSLFGESAVNQRIPPEISRVTLDWYQYCGKCSAWPEIK